jgi:hypothetical protein
LTSVTLSLPAATVKVDAVGGVGERGGVISEGVIVAVVGADVVKAEAISVVAEVAQGVAAVRRSMSRTPMLSQAWGSRLAAAGRQTIDSGPLRHRCSKIHSWLYFNQMEQACLSPSLTNPAIAYRRSSLSPSRNSSSLLSRFSLSRHSVRKKGNNRFCQ